MRFPSTFIRMRLAVASAMLAGAALAPVAAEHPRGAFEPGSPQEIVVHRTAKELFEKGLLPDPNGPLAYERMPKTSAPTLEERLREISLASPFLSVGRLTPLLPAMNGSSSVGSCTATWLGETAGYTYVLTAAHCVEPRAAAESRITATFLGWDDSLLAMGDGVAFIPAAIVGDFGTTLAHTANDIALLKLPTVERPLNDLGMPLEQPLLDDVGNWEAGPVHLVGYGSRKIDSQALGSGRWWGKSRWSGSTQADGLVEIWINAFDDQRWASGNFGDSGSAVWQSRYGFWSGFATVSGGESHLFPDLLAAPTYAAPIPNHIDWIRRIFPQVQTLSDRLTVRHDKPFVSRGLEQWSTPGGAYFTVREKDGTRGGPASKSPDHQRSTSVVYTAVTDERTGDRKEIKLRMGAQADCKRDKPVMWRPETGQSIDNPVTSAKEADIFVAELVATFMMAGMCEMMPRPLRVSFHEEDNPSLAPGTWTGRLDIDVKRSGDDQLVYRLPINVELIRKAP